MSHEQSITIEMDGKHYILPTVYQGKKVTDDEAVGLFRQGKIKELGVFNSQREADAAAKKRSESFDDRSILRQMFEMFSGGRERPAQ